MDYDSGNGLIDYDVYVMSKKEKGIYLLIMSALIFTVANIFYHSVVLSLLLCPFSYFYLKIKTNEIIKKRKNELNSQFKDMLYSLSSSLSAGRSMESAFRHVKKDLSIIYPNEDTYILKEVEIIIRKIEMNETVESVLDSFSKRAHLEDVENFADVLRICKRTGGNIVEVIRNTSNIINDKLQIKQEIETIISEKRFEQKILTVMPIALIFVLSQTAGDYMEPVFSCLAGRVVMTIAIIIIATGILISRKIMDIKV